jgi:hypothetical protein
LDVLRGDWKKKGSPLPQLPAEGAEGGTKKWKAKEKEQPIAPIVSRGSGRIVKLKKWKAKRKCSPLP